MYGTALAVKAFDAVAFLLTSTLVIPNRSELAHPLTRLWMHITGVSLLPFALACWLFHGNHIRHSKVGRTLGSVFLLSNATSAVLYCWSAMARMSVRFGRFGMLLGEGLLGVGRFGGCWRFERIAWAML
jgi:hypothetical protein